MQLPSWIAEYGAVTVATFAGSVANGKAARWRRADGRFDGWQVFTEGATVVGLAIGLIALADYGHGLVDLKVMCGGGVLFGWLGPEPVASWVLQKLGVKKDA